MKNFRIDVMTFPKGDIIVGIYFNHDKYQNFLTLNLFKWSISIGHYR